MADLDYVRPLQTSPASSAPAPWTSIYRQTLQWFLNKKLCFSSCSILDFFKTLLAPPAKSLRSCYILPPATVTWSWFLQRALPALPADQVTRRSVGDPKSYPSQQTGNDRDFNGHSTRTSETPKETPETPCTNASTTETTKLRMFHFIASFHLNFMFTIFHICFTP